MSNRGRAKPTPASKDFTIWGTQQQSSTEYLNDPTRRRTASEREARRVRIGLEIEASVRAKCPMVPVREADQIAALEETWERS